MTQVITILNLQQGGGKTTTTLNLATALRQRGHNVLAVDLAAEGTLLQRVRVPNSPRLGRSGSNLLATSEGWHLMPSTVSLTLLHTRSLYRVVRQTVFQDELRALLDPFDYVLIDGSTSEMTMLLEALSLSDEVIVPFDSESLQFYDAVGRLQELFAERRAINPRLRFGGVFLARYAPRVRRAREMLTALYEAVGPINCFSAYLNDSNELRQAEQRRCSVIADAPTSRAARAFAQLAEQLTEAIVPRMLPQPTLRQTTPLQPPIPVVITEGARPQMIAEPAASVVQAIPAPAAPSWLERAQTVDDENQALRYAVLALARGTDYSRTLAWFEERFTARLGAARWQDVELLAQMGEHLAEHGFDHYAAQAFRRAIELNPNFVRAWAGLALTSHAEVERTHALEMCLRLDEGLAAAESPESPRRPRSRTAPRPALMPARFLPAGV